MRISDWSSDVCSSDLPDNPLFALEGEAARRVLFTPHIAGVTRQSSATLFREAWANVERVLVRGERSEERRVGKEGVVRVDLGGRRIIKKNKHHYKDQTL